MGKHSKSDRFTTFGSESFLVRNVFVIFWLLSKKGIVLPNIDPERKARQKTNQLNAHQ